MPRQPRGITRVRSVRAPPKLSAECPRTPSRRAGRSLRDRRQLVRPSDSGFFSMRLHAATFFCAVAFSSPVDCFHRPT